MKVIGASGCFQRILVKALLALFGISNTYLVGDEKSVETALQPSIQLLLGGDFSESLESAIEVSLFRPESPLVWNIIGKNYFFLEEYESSREAFEKCLSFDGKLEDIANEYLFALILLDRFDEIREIGDEVLNLPTNTAFVAVAQITILGDRGDVDGFEQLVLGLPDDFLEVRLCALAIARCSWYFAKEPKGIPKDDRS